MRFILSIFLLFIYIFDLEAQIEKFSDIFRVRQSRDYIPDLRDGRGIAFRDLNEDNMPDIYLVCYATDNHLLINSGAYRPFKDMTTIAHLGANPRPLGVFNFEIGKTTFDFKYGTCIADFDNDGDGDIIVAGWGIATSFFRNDGHLRFANITNQLDLFPPVTANGCIAADIDNDGLTDLFILESHLTNRLLLNQGDLYFGDITQNRGLNIGTNSRSAAFCDIDIDGDQDLYVANWEESDVIYKNNGNGFFKPVPLLNDVFVQPINSSSVAFGDIDNDGDYDIIITTHQKSDYLLINQSIAEDSAWVFEQVKLNQNTNTNGTTIGDFDNNGWPDIFTTGEHENIIYMNHQNRNFTEIIHDVANTYCTGVAYADFDLDGDLDIFVTSHDSTALFYQNITNNKSYLKIHLVGVTSSRDAIGATVQLTPPDMPPTDSNIIGTRFISGGSGYSSMNEPIIHFGTDTLSLVDAHIIFPCGRRLTEYGLRPGNSYEIHEYSLLSRTAIESFQHMVSLTQQAVFWYQVVLGLLFFIITFIFIRLGLRRYRWTPTTASAYLVGFFFLALIAIVALKKLGLLYNLLTINVLTVLFVLTVILSSERLLRLRKIREKYRTVLLDLTTQIVNIHDDADLITLVTENIRRNTEFGYVDVLRIDPDQKRIQIKAKKNVPELIKGKGVLNIINRIKQEKYLAKNNFPDISDLFKYLDADFIFSIERNGRLYAILLLGSSKDPSAFSQEDIELFKSIVNQMAIAMENNEYIRRSNEMIKKLTAAEVREKYLTELEATNAALDSKNRDLQKLYNELRDTQTQLIHSEKMASLGQLVAGISHELNNPIGFIYANIRQLKSYTERIASLINDKKASDKKFVKIDQLMPDIENLIEDTINGSQMIKDLVENLRRFSHLDRSKWSVSNIHDGIESSLKILLPQFKRKLQIHRKFRAGGFIECNAGQLNQVFLNILTNAAQAIKDQGNIWIETEDKDNNVYICIRDDGTGMSAATQQKLFDPFYTTKDVGEGTGLGLSISYSIIQNHAGRIEVESKLNEGSTFTIILPHRRPAPKKRSLKPKKKATQ
jgi:two-component system NtrC family sensor kinase